MNLERLISMVIRQLMNRGVRTGIKMASQRGEKRPQDMTPEERELARQARDQNKSVRNMSRITRRMGRF